LPFGRFVDGTHVKFIVMLWATSLTLVLCHLQHADKMTSGKGQQIKFVAECRPSRLAAEKMIAECGNWIAH